MPAKKEERGCEPQTQAKYRSRASPSYPANECCGQTKVGNDGRTYVSSRVGNQKYCTWKLVKEWGGSPAAKPRRTSPSHPGYEGRKPILEAVAYDMAHNQADKEQKKLFLKNKAYFLRYHDHLFDEEDFSPPLKAKSSRTVSPVRWAKETIPELIKICREAGIKGYSGLKKAELLHLMRNHPDL